MEICEEKKAIIERAVELAIKETQKEIETMSNKKYYTVSFPDIENIVLKAIVYYEENGYSAQNLRKITKEYFKRKEGGKK